MLWYNAPLMKKWGYTVPTTWEEYQALGEKVATEHPGYLVGDAGDTFTPEIYLWASKCGANQITGPKAVTVNTTSEACTKMATLLDTLIKNKTMSISSVFSTDFDKNQADKVLHDARPGLVRRRGVPGHLQDPGQPDRGGARCRSGPGDTAPSTGNVGGGTWLLSAHSTHLKAATDFLTWVDHRRRLPGQAGARLSRRTRPRPRPGWRSRPPPATSPATSPRAAGPPPTRSGRAGATASSARRRSGRPPSRPA